MRVVVVGGGLAGLFTASELAARGADDVVVVEADDLPGGIARTVERDRFSLEPAAGSFTLPHPHLSPILGRAAVATTAARNSSLRHVFVAGRLVSLRPSPAALLAPVMPIGAKLRALAEPLAAAASDDDGESLAAFCRRRFGHEAGSLLGSLMASGVFAGDAEHLSAEAAFPMVVALEREQGSVVRGILRRRKSRSDVAPRPTTHVPVGGMAGLAERVAASLGDRFRGSFPVRAIHREAPNWIVSGPEDLRADAVVIAVGPTRAAELLQGEIAETLRRSAAAEVAVVGVGGLGLSPLPHGFGALVGPDEGMTTVGALFESSYAPARAPDGGWLAKSIVGGALHPEVSRLSDDQVEAKAIRDLSRIVDTDLSPHFVEVVRHRPGIPQYVTGHLSWLETLEHQCPTGLHLSGWGYRGVGVAGLATDAVRIAKRFRPPEA